MVIELWLSTTEVSHRSHSTGAPEYRFRPYRTADSPNPDISGEAKGKDALALAVSTVRTAPTGSIPNGAVARAPGI